MRLARCEKGRIMSDNLDHATELTERYTQSAIKTFRKPVGPQPNGRCHWCDEIVNDEARFCDPICRDNYDKYGAPK